MKATPLRGGVCARASGLYSEKTEIQIDRERKREEGKVLF